MDEKYDESCIPISEWPVTVDLASKMVLGDQEMLPKPKICKHKPLAQRPILTEPHSKKSKLNQDLLLSEREKLHSTDRCVHNFSSDEISINESYMYESNDRFNDSEPLVQIKVAKWWRRNKTLRLKPLPTTNSPNTMLFHISRTEECRNYLMEERKRLQKKCRNQLFQDKAEVHAALASIEDWLGAHKVALDSISHAVELDANNSEYKWLKAKLQKQCRVNDIQKLKMEQINTFPHIFPSVSEVERISAKDLGQDEFLELFVYKRRPVILFDVLNDMTSSTWNLDFIKSIAGSVKAVVKHAVPMSVEWAKLEQSHELTVEEFINQVQAGQTSDYLFDWSLPLHCQKLAEKLKIPKYFTGNYLHQTSSGSLYHDSWPSLFIAPKGVVSGLHIDAFASHFWMALFEGEKRWTFFDADDTPFLYPQYIHSMDPVFSVDLADVDLEQWPLLASTKPRQCVLHSGELLFVPAGSAHYVENLTVSLAVSANHVDQSNYKQVCEELKVNGLIDPRAADLVQQLEHPEFLHKVQGSR